MFFPLTTLKRVRVFSFCFCNGVSCYLKCIFGPLDSLFVGRDLVFNFFVSLFLTPERDDVRLPFAVMGRRGSLYNWVEVIFCISFAFSHSKAKTHCFVEGLKKRGFGGSVAL